MKNFSMTEEEFDNRLNHSYKLGISSGLQQASGVLLKKATYYFEHNCDTDAKMLRSLSEDLKKQADREHPRNEQAL